MLIKSIVLCVAGMAVGFLLASAASAQVLGVAPTVNNVAERLTERPGTIVEDLPEVCSGDYGCANIEANIIYMRPYLAYMLNDLNSVQPYQAALAVLTFAHEARHVRSGFGESQSYGMDLTWLFDTYNETYVQQWAVAHAYEVALELGATKAWADEMRKWIPVWNERMGV